MKIFKILLGLIFFTLFSDRIYAQQVVEYDTCSQLQQFEGEYKYINGTEEIKVFLRFHHKINFGQPFGLDFDTVVDLLYGWIEYKSNGLIIESTYANRFSYLPYDANLLNRNSYSLILKYNGQYGCGSNFLTGGITDFGHSSQSKTIYVEVQNNGLALDWSQYHNSGYGAFNGDYGMTLPAHFVLIKQ